MDPGERTGTDDEYVLAKPALEPRQVQLPTDLPTSLDNRKPMTFEPGVDVYDAWQGASSDFLHAEFLC